MELCFAQIEGNQVVTFGSLIAMVLAAWQAARTARYSYMSNRDKLEFDTERSLLKAKVASLEEDMKEQKSREEQCQRRVSELERRIDELTRWKIGRPKPE